MNDEQALARCKELGVEKIETSITPHYQELSSIRELLETGKSQHMVLGHVSYKAVLTKAGQSYEGHSSQSIGEAIERALQGMQILGAMP